MAMQTSAMNADCAATKRLVYAPLISPPALGADSRDASTPTITSALSCATRLRDACHEEIGGLARIVRALSCHILLRGTDGSVIPLTTTGDEELAALTSREPRVSTPIYDHDGSAMGGIVLFVKAGHVVEPTVQVLHALMGLTARAMSERWFRLYHRREWIFAARREDEVHTSIILAIERSRTLIGADHAAREFLEAAGKSFEPGLSIYEVFGGDFAPAWGRRYGDVALQLSSSDAASPWLALITPPGPGTVHGRRGERLQVHTRPRLDALDSATIAAKQEQHCRLPPGMQRSIEQYIDDHLGRALPVAELASHLGISQSYFARSFRNSVGLTPHSYVMGRRLLCAQELLTNTELPLIDIALSTGFADQSHFCRRFHQMTGMPPRTFRLRHSASRARPESTTCAAT